MSRDYHYRWQRDVNINSMNVILMDNKHWLGIFYEYILSKEFSLEGDYDVYNSCFIYIVETNCIILIWLCYIIYVGCYICVNQKNF